MIALALLATLALVEVTPAEEWRAPTAVVNADTSYSRLVQRAREAYDAREWNEAADLWRSALLVDDGVGEHWLAMAESMFRAERYREAVSAYQRAIQLRALSADDGALKIAQAYAQLGNAKQAARWTELAQHLRGTRSPRAVEDEARRSFAVRRA